eukprot:CAMPEP_0170455044 /NCGR_PEP_ID=MMETSP0123-20130129/3108_1 /TAXON_ID=182087 /ORGANISM="Favella ehrenbergii, Strain Fehren 1" /LENGTH=158 /DNA_ID=CAMNT_0010717987 /DNA_START=389 /DNA_END=866 /DNA_ORIENTATION=+
MDEELFRTYFIRLFRGIRQMEQKFADVMDPEEDDCFVRYSKAMCDLADIFKIAKQEKPREDRDVTELTKKKTFKKNQIEVSKMIFGLGAAPKRAETKLAFSASCRPKFSASPMERDRNKNRHTNADLRGALKKKNAGHSDTTDDENETPEMSQPNSRR